MNILDDISNGSSQPVDSVNIESYDGPYICPICQEDMLTLLQLNRHLDDAHKEVQRVKNETVSAWFKKRVAEAKKSPAVVALNQKLNKLDMEDRKFGEVSFLNATESPVLITENAERVLSEQQVDQSHWQRITESNVCSEPTCGKPLVSRNGRVHCRCCGRLFCELHTLYQMKLGRNARHEPVQGLWCRVCENCFKSRLGYNDYEGLMINKFHLYLALRKPTVEKEHLEFNRLEKRLSKLVESLTAMNQEQSFNFVILRSMSALSTRRRNIEQTVVSWENDESVKQCPICRREFSYALRKHHCRICGGVFCADLPTHCSTELLFDEANTKVPLLHEKDPLKVINPSIGNTDSNSSISLRICGHCQKILFSRRKFVQDLREKPGYIKIHEVRLFSSTHADQLEPAAISVRCRTDAASFS